MKNNYGPLFKFCRFLVRLVYPKYTIQGQPIHNEPVVYVSHHQNLFGPFILLLWFKHPIRTWMHHVFLDQDACYKQYASYTFSQRFGWKPFVAKAVAWPISHFIPKLMHSGKGLPVYRGTRDILHTLQESVDALTDGESLAIFPDIDYRDSSSEVKSMYEGFLYLEKYYF